jgi:hypothetical protein
VEIRLDRIVPPQDWSSQINAVALEFNPPSDANLSPVLRLPKLYLFLTFGPAPRRYSVIVLKPDMREIARASQLSRERISCFLNAIR